MGKALVSLSGGLDSTTVVAKALAEGMDVECVGFFYDSKHNEYENKAAAEIASHYNLPFELISLEDMMKSFQSALMKSGGAIPEGHYQAANMAETIVPSRNIIFAATLSGLAWNKEVDEVWMGIHSGDHVIYPDCRPSFFIAMKRAIETGTDNRVTLTAPFLAEDKKSIVDWGLKNGVPYHLTRTCYKDQKDSCGKCGACRERLEAFRFHRQTDPIKYNKQF